MAAVHFVGEAAVSFDHRHHFWLGVAPQWLLANPQYARDRWFALAGEAGWRF